jgi:hypothetical protein
VRIENVPLKLQKKSSTGTWLEFWQVNAKKTASKCATLGCETPAEVGAQVFKPSFGPGSVYIVPLCSAHAAKEKEAFEIAESVPMILAKK